MRTFLYLFVGIALYMTPTIDLVRFWIKHMDQGDIDHITSFWLHSMPLERLMFFGSCIAMGNASMIMFGISLTITQPVR